MTKRCLTLSALASLGLLSLGLVAGAGCGSQRRVACAPRADDFSVKLTLVAGSKTGTGDCDQRFDGAESVQVMGMQPFFNAPGSADRVNSVAIQPLETGTYLANAAMVDPPVADKNPAHKPFAFGKFKTESPDSNDICHVDMLSAAEIEYDMFMLPPPPPDQDAGAGATDGGGAEAGTDAGATPSDGGRDGGGDGAVHALDAGDAPSPEAGGAPEAGGNDAGACTAPEQPTPQTMFPAKHVKYEFTNLQLYVTVALTGSIMSGDLTYTQVTPAGVCTAKFKMRGVSASVNCADPMCGKPSNDICDTADGIPKDISTMCDPEAMLCVLNDGARKDTDKDTHIPQ